jgi:hypothetical protein
MVAPCRSRVAVLAATLAALLSAPAIATSAVPATGTGADAAHAAHAAQRCDGVWVVVDATRLRGGISTSCAAGEPSSGLAALTAAGHDYTPVPRFPGMVCTIDGRPDPCNGAPTDAHWSYWHASAGGDWEYASRGAGSRTPPRGSVEGWAFGAGQPPGRPPPGNSDAERTGGPNGPGDGDRTAGSVGGARGGDASTPGPSGSDRGRAGGAQPEGPSSDRHAAGGAATGLENDRTARPGGSEPAGPAEGATSGGTEDDERGDGPAADGGRATGDDRTDRVHPARVARQQAASTASDDVAEDADAAEDEAVLLATGGNGGGLPVGALVGAALVAGIAVAALVRSRRPDRQELA